MKLEEVLQTESNHFGDEAEVYRGTCLAHGHNWSLVIPTLLETSSLTFFLQCGTDAYDLDLALKTLYHCRDSIIL